MQIYDVAFVGSGLSSSATLYHLLSSLKNNPHIKGLKKIAVIEKHPEFWKGIPYGSRSSIHSMTINPTKDFFQDDERPVFFDWVKNLQRNGWPNIAEKEKAVLHKWFTNKIANNPSVDTDAIYIPRFLYGMYLSKKLNDTVAEAAGIASVDLITAEATGVAKKDGIYSVTFNEKDKTEVLQTRLLILATGSLDTKLVRNTPHEEHLCINDIYAPSLEQNFDTIITRLATLETEKRNILVIGSKASASEIVHLIGKYQHIDGRIVNKITVLSNSGRLPELLYVHNDDYSHLLENLERLGNGGKLTANELMEAIEKDVASAMDKKYTMGQIYYSLSDKAVKLQRELSADEQLKFFNHHGWSLTRITRRTSEDYHVTEQELINDKILEFIKGRFTQLFDDDGSGFAFSYKQQKDATELRYPQTFPIVINCVGAQDIVNSSSPLIRSLFENGVCSVNHNQMGIAVDEDFAANDNLYIIGPLLAGIYNSKYKFWHLENAKRLNGLAAILAQTLLTKIAG